MYRCMTILAAAMFSLAAAAQNLDPTVVVSRAYEGNLVEVHKPALEMSVPDSVHNFRLDFDYSVFDSPYKGSYEFNPYMTTMRPASSAFKPQTFYLRAGAGYRLYPVADIVWSPSFKKGFSMDVYASHRSYVGDYRAIYPILSGDNTVLSANGEWNGYDLRTNAGVAGRYDWSAGVLDFDVAYLGIHSKDYMKSRAYNGVNATVGVRSKAARTFIYDVDLGYRFAADRGLCRLGEQLFSLDADLGPQFKTAHKILFDMGVDMATYSTAPEWAAARMNFTPHYVYEKGRWRLNLGLKIDFLVAPGESNAVRSVDRQQVLYPDVNVEFAVIKDAMNLYAAAKGGNYLNTYSQIVGRNHFADPTFFHGRGIDSTVERLKALVGLKGRIGSRFSYDLNGGYAGYANQIFDAVYVEPDLRSPAGIGYSSCQMAFAELGWVLDTERFRFDGNMKVSHYWGFEDVPGLFAPSLFTGDTSVEYNIRKRIFFGADCSFATSRKTVAPIYGFSDFIIPGYADLGVNVEVVTSRKLSFWARGGNLLNMTIQRTPLYAEGGINFTVGICLNL